jgi:hypothetical protein
MEVPFNRTSAARTATGNGPRPKISANLISMDIKIDIG